MNPSRYRYALTARMYPVLFWITGLVVATLQ